jgi:steroid delta-isomerase-like uncharacterized protein
MTLKDPKQLVVRYWYQELWDNWNISIADDLFTDDYRLHLSGVPVTLDREAAKQVIGMFGAAFPDLKHTVDEMIADGATVAARWTGRGIHRGDFQGIAPTGKPVTVSGTTFHHMRGERIAETWLTMDTNDLLQQLGTVPSQAAVPAPQAD